MIALTLALAGAAALNKTEPPVKVTLNSDNTYVRGDNAQVHVEAAREGYLLVLRADEAGTVRVLYPVDPSANGTIQGGKKVEIRGRGDRDAFTVDDAAGSGVVLAAWSPTPFDFTVFQQDGHWDAAQLNLTPLGSDREAGLVDLVQKMSDQHHFDYDFVTYTVRSAWAYFRTPYVGPYWNRWPVGVGYPFVRFGWGWRGWGWPR